MLPITPHTPNWRRVSLTAWAILLIPFKELLGYTAPPLESNHHQEDVTFCYYLICSFVRQTTSISGYVAIQPVLVEDLCFCLPIIRYIFIATILCNLLKHKKPLITSDRVSENPSSSKNPVYQRGNISYKNIFKFCGPYGIRTRTTRIDSAAL